MRRGPRDREWSAGPALDSTAGGAEALIDNVVVTELVPG